MDSTMPVVEYDEVNYDTNLLQGEHELKYVTCIHSFAIKVIIVI